MTFISVSTGFYCIPLFNFTRATLKAEAETYLRLQRIMITPILLYIPWPVSKGSMHYIECVFMYDDARKAFTTQRCGQDP